MDRRLCRGVGRSMSGGARRQSAADRRRTADRDQLSVRLSGAMRAILLAAGLGTRLRPITDTLPKCLVPIAGRPLLVHWLESLLAESRIERVLVNTHYLPDQVRAVVAGLPYRERIDLVQEPQLLGTGGTVLANRAWCGPAPLFVAHADNLTDAPPSFIITPHLAQRSQVAMTMMAFRTPSPRTCGILELDAGD